MTQLLESALRRISSLPPAQQDALARMILGVIEGEADALEDIAVEHVERLAKGIEDADARRFATTQEVQAAFARFGA